MVAIDSEIRVEKTLANENYNFCGSSEDCESPSCYSEDFEQSYKTFVDQHTQTEAIETCDQKIEVKPKTYVKSCQKSISTKDVNTQTKLLTKDAQITCNIIADIGKEIRNLQIKKNHNLDILNSTSESILSSILDTSNSFNPSTKSSSKDSLACQINFKKVIQEKMYENYSKTIIEDNPLLFLGINKNSMFVIDLLSKKSGISIKDIYLTLKKIRTNQSSAVLAYEFGISQSHACRVFNKNVHIIAKYFKCLIIWPSKKEILLNLPLQFRHRYSDVQSIIDCFEIEIEKPSNAVYQALTWSDYKKCNTAKYLISITPDGLINYMSEGACGRCTDIAIVENCGYLDVLPSNVAVLADRGFKQLDGILNKKNCKLLRPPSVKQNIKSTKKDVKLTKQIASVRIHVERVINRIRHFRFLDIHTRTENNLLDCLDSAVIIAAALVNLQTEVIKQN